MTNDGQKPQGAVPRPGWANGFRPFRTISRIVSSGASTVASTVRSAASAASSMVDRDDDTLHDQVLWAGFDKLEADGNITRKVLLLCYRSGFQVWDVEDGNNVRDLVSLHDGPASFLQMLPKPMTAKRSQDKFVDSRPLLVICAALPSGSGGAQDAAPNPSNGSTTNSHDLVNGSSMPTLVRFFSFQTRSYVHVLKFRSVVYSVRCSARVIAISQAAQIHCFDASTLEREYTILTNPIVPGCLGSGSIGYGPLAVGCRWLAYSGNPVVSPDSGRVSPQHLMPSASFPSSAANGSLVAHYAKESSKQLAAGIVNLGDLGYKKLSRYCSELLPDTNYVIQSGTPGWKVNGTINGHQKDADSVGMVIVRDIVSKTVISQFRAHKSPISALCFDPSGTLLVTASVQGHNINVFRIMPAVHGSSSGIYSGASCMHLYRLQRGFTNAVIQDISFSDDSYWIMISSSRGTSHLFPISPFGGPVVVQASEASFSSKPNGLNVAVKTGVWMPPNSGLQLLSEQNFCAPGPPVTLSAASRIRSGSNGWKGTVTGAAAAATGRQGSISGHIASSFHSCNDNNLQMGSDSLKSKYNLLVFSPSGCVVQYVIRVATGLELGPVAVRPGSAYNTALDCDGQLVVEAIQKWNICQKQSRRGHEENIDIYGENGSLDSCKVFPEGMEKDPFVDPTMKGVDAKKKTSPEDKNQLYISEAELQMHQARVPLWAKSEVCFHAMTIPGVELVDDGSIGGEMEIERIPARAIEARSKDLVPVIDYLQSTKFHHFRVPALDSSGRLGPQRSVPSEEGTLSCRGSSGSLDSMTEGSSVMPGMQNHFERKPEWEGLGIQIEASKGFVNNNDSPKVNTQFGIVNNTSSFKMDGQFKFVNNSKGGLTMENEIEDRIDEFD